MPTGNELKRDVVRLCTELLDRDLALRVNPPRMRTVRGRQIIDSTDYSISASFPLNQIASVEEYRTIIRSRLYTCLLFDGGVLQIRYEVKRRNLVGHRLCYYPAPAILEPTDYRPGEDDIEEAIFLRLASGLQGELDAMFGEHEEQRQKDGGISVLGPLRFEFDEAEVPQHPFSHLHLSRSDCRIPVFAPLSVGHFVRFVFRHFYTNVWQEQEIIRQWPLRDFTRTIRPEEQHRMHLEKIAVL